MNIRRTIMHRWFTIWPSPGKSRWYLAVLIGNKEFKWFTIERDEAEIEALMTAEADFWELVKADTPPAVDGTAATTAAVKTIYADNDDRNVDLFGHSTDLQQFVALGQQIKELEAMRDEVANRIKVFMGEAGSGECDGFRVSWKTQARRTFDINRFTKENPGVDLSSYYNTTYIRAFRVSEMN